MSEGDALKLHALRSALSGIRHLEEAARLFVARAQVPGVIAPDQRPGLEKSLLELLGAMAKAMDENDIAAITAIRDRTRIHGDFVREIRRQLGPSSGGSLDQSALFVDFEFVAWTLHHLTKILVRLEPPRQPPAPG